jgi:hypothetical protein
VEKAEFSSGKGGFSFYSRSLHWRGKQLEFSSDAGIAFFFLQSRSALERYGVDALRSTGLDRFDVSIMSSFALFSTIYWSNKLSPSFFHRWHAIQMMRLIVPTTARRLLLLWRRLDAVMVKESPRMSFDGRRNRIVIGG